MVLLQQRHQRQLQQTGSFSQPMSGGSVLGQVGLSKASSGGSGAAIDVPTGKTSPAAPGPKAGVQQGIITGTSSEAGLEQAAALVRFLDTPKNHCMLLGRCRRVVQSLNFEALEGYVYL